MDIDQRRARREALRRERARRRARGLAVVVAIGALVLVGVVLASGCGASQPSGARKTATNHPNRRSSATSSKGASSGSTGEAAGTASGAIGTDSVPILMYHVINSPPVGAKFPGLYVPPQEFSDQMSALQRAGFHAVTMDQMLANWTRGAPLPAGKPIVLSFDNGYQSQLTEALPVLRRLGWVGVENIQLTGLPPSQGGLSTTQVAELVSAGWELDTQGISHADLITLGPDALREQVALARSRLQHRYHVPVNWFCYPSGHYNPTVIAEVKAAGYVGSTTVVPGWAGSNQDRYRLPRLRVLGGTSGPELLSELAAIHSNPAPPTSYGLG
jgi:peptidoglycan/xylan/chitin deacetylase (PgdA/CDA1 family)